MKISTFLKPLSFLPALALMYMIYSFSAQTGEDSSMLSYRASEAIVRTVNTVTAQNWDDCRSRPMHHSSTGSSGRELM